MRSKQSQFTWPLFVRCSILLSTLAAICVAAAVGGVNFFSYVTGFRLDRFASEVPFLIYPIVWTLGVISAGWKHRSIALAALLTVLGVVGYVILGLAMYWVAMYVYGGFHVR